MLLAASRCQQAAAMSARKFTPRAVASPPLCAPCTDGVESTNGIARGLGVLSHRAGWGGGQVPLWMLPRGDSFRLRSLQDLYGDQTSMHTAWDHLDGLQHRMTHPPLKEVL